MQKRLNKRKLVAVGVLSLFAIFIVVYAAIMIKHRLEYAITNAVFVDSDNISNVGFERVRGKILKMFKKEGDWVKKHEIIAEIDPTPYQIAMKQLKRKIEALRKNKEKLYITLSKISEEITIKRTIAMAKVKENENQIEALKRIIAASDVKIAQLKEDVNRYKNLYKKGAVAKRTYETYLTHLRSAILEQKAQRKRLKALINGLTASKKEVELVMVQKKNLLELKKSIESLKDEINSLKAKLENVMLDLKYCKLISPINGRVAKKYVSIGDVVSPGIPVYALVNPKDIYILVLLEETKLKGIAPGCPAKIKIDAFPDDKYLGVVEEILPTSAAKFALVPRDISAGEFTKVVQRMQVKVKITRGNIDKLVIGMGGEIEIKRKRDEP